MKPGTPLPITAQRLRGFTLIEIMIAVVIVAILAAIALPSFMDSIRKGRRSDAFTALSALQQAQERWRGNKAAYANNGQLTLAPNATPPGLGLTATSPAGRYAIALSGTSATGYTATATAQGSQANDVSCKTLAVMVAGGNISYGSGQAAVDWADPGRCWAR